MSSPLPTDRTKFIAKTEGYQPAESADHVRGNGDIYNGGYPDTRGAWFCKNPPITMPVNCPLGPNTHVKRKVEPSEGLSLWFADVPEGGLTEDTYLSGCVSFYIRVSSGGFTPDRAALTSLVLTFASLVS
jgi:hypothetical protein